MPQTPSPPPREPAPRRRRWPRVIALVIVLLVFLVLGALIVSIVRGPVVPARAVLVVDLREALPERTKDGLLDLLGAPRIDVTGLRSVLRSAAGDPRVLGIFLRVGARSLDLALAEEVAGQAQAFRRAGKFIVARAEGPDAAGYLAAAAADEVVLDPSTELDLVGVSAQAVFLGDALRRLGIRFDLVRVGEYKGAFEELTAGRPSPAFQEALSQTVESIHATLVEEIAAARKLDPARVRAAIDDGPFLPDAAVEAKLVDSRAFGDELPAIIARRAGGPEPEPFDAADYLASIGDGGAGPRIALVRVCGLLVDGPASPDLGETTSAEEVAEALREIRKDGSIKGVLLRIDSPGGSVTASERIWREVLVTRNLKPVVASLGGAAASGGYYAACAAERIIARPATITGSIGVFGGKLIVDGLLGSAEVHVESVSRGRRAGMFDITRPFSDDERAALTRSIQDAYHRFVDRVADGRKKPFEEAERLARGRVWTGREALANGLVDELGGIEEAIEAVKARAGIPPGEEVALKAFPPRRSLVDLLGGRRRMPSFEGPARGPASASLDARAVERLLLACGLDGRKPLALSPMGIVLRF
jgi:protease IV